MTNGSPTKTPESKSASHDHRGVLTMIGIVIVSEFEGNQL